ncbi:phage portal protein [Pseudophaeobacter flagellatus]|uniref:phage portal protein n=1 Tax=Pseudophaeobacter flagellatus TaxID=2899119 RepID=UPI001E4962FD|nr:phage portal protein [Pseudophaeobacter flagellatus]MCD9146733.1 phage portal protein [Pseudophaeobacter flagellatus]
MIWPFRKKSDLEQRSGFSNMTQTYVDARRKTLQADGSAALSATVATAVGMWSRGFTMITPAPADLLTPDTMGAIGLDLCLRGESVWHIRVEGNVAKLLPVAYWDELGQGRYHLHIARVNTTETVRALEPEVLKLVINPAPSKPWRGRSPFTLMGLSPMLMAEIEAAVSGAMPMVGKGLLPMSANIPEEQQSKVLSGLRTGSLATVLSKQDFGHQTGGDRSELRRVELTPDLQKMDLNPATDGLHHRILSAAGIPPALVTEQGNAGAMREAYRLFALQTLEPMGRQLMPEFQAKLNVASLNLDAMMSADTAGRARSVGALVKAGVDLERAMKLVGWTE